MKRDKVLVTGGAGFIGSHVVDQLIRQKYNVVVVDNLSTGQMGNVNKAAKFYLVDVRSDDLSKVFSIEEPEYVIHMAAQVGVQKSVSKPIFDAEVNILGTLNVLEASKGHGVKKIVYISSAAVYGEPEYLGVDESHSISPLSFYGASKYAIEHYLKIYNAIYSLRYTILRYANVYGPRQSTAGEGGVVALFTENMVLGEQPIIFGDGRQSRDFVYVKDVARGTILALHNADQSTVNISTNNPISVNSLYAELSLLIPTYADRTPSYSKPRKGDILHSYLTNTEAKNLLDWVPKYTLRDGLKETVSYYRHTSSSRKEAAATVHESNR